ncbi:DUF6151 family protein [Leisingera methylohalidivorans]|uniref:CENP-V/GFA domain-containing protein n=1 Tax=Leisingera methylohalidivorans DSM 14336 TaxID=999552 RepID=V9VQX4_9RHOB|nr:DUF6151 family protein [Leisingera methylohalidivorans]AHD00418.1 hypothetical protein METH_06460 [Leisingera methylohalidivorans DSM 14336]
MGDGLAFSCNCGALRGEVSAQGIKDGTRVVCYCADCRANELHHGRPDPAPDPVDLFQLAPDSITITQGAAHLKALRFGPRGPLRWYASCCGTPFANTLAKPTLPFAGMRADLFQDTSALGKIRAKAFLPVTGKQTRTKGGGVLAWGILSRMITSRLSGRWRETPFFDAATGKPVAEPELLCKDQRAKLYS